MSTVTRASAASQAAVVGTDLGSFVKMVTTSGMVLGPKVVPSRGSARPRIYLKDPNKVSGQTRAKFTTKTVGSYQADT